MRVKNVKLSIVVFVVFLGLASIFYANAKYTIISANHKVNRESNDRVILIDPGHGGIDGGGVSKNGTIEKDINLKIGLKLREKLTNDGYKVIMTREDDIGLYTDEGRIRKKKIEDLNNRCKIKKDTQCDMFISIHLNMFQESKYHGAQVWYSKNKDSQRFAKILQENLRKDLDINNNRQEKPALDSYKVLRYNDDMPSVLVECGFLSNQEEEQNLKSEEYQNKIAQSIENSIKTYYNQ